MGGTQTFLVIGGIALFSLLVLNSNRLLMYSEDQTLRSEYLIAATTVGEDIISEITSKAFDESTVSGDPIDLNLITLPGSLGSETGETSVSLYDDIDDYHGYQRTVATPRAGDFNTQTSVSYVDQNNLNSVVLVRTKTKRIKVNVTSPFLQDTVSLYFYKSN